MTREGRSPLDEQVIRRALRLDVDEVPARLDPAFVAAAARASSARRGELWLAAGASFVAGWVWAEGLRAVVGGLIGGTGLDPLGATIGVVSSALVVAAPIVSTATQPAVPIAILVAALVAALFERRRLHVAST